MPPGADAEGPALLSYGQHKAGRILAIGGASMVAAGMLVGEVYAIYISHVLNGIIGSAWVEAITASAGGELDTVRSRFDLIEELAAKRGRTMHAHSHLGAFGLLALVLAFLQSRIRLAFGPPELPTILALAYVAGSLLHVLATYSSFYAGPAVLWLADLGSVLVIGVVLTTLLGLRSGGDGIDPAGLVKEHLGEPASRYLVKSGVLLVLLGMLFGFYYAWRLVSADEPAVYSSVSQAVVEAAAGQGPEAREAVTHFKRAQSKIAITAAAHSHAIEFGFLMLLLALSQRFVMLSSRWRFRWAVTLSVGTFALPICVLLATRFGLRAAAFSDLFGGIALLALIAMIVGMIRQSGATDVDTGSSDR